MVILIDNYDSFSYNLYQAVGKLQPDIRVIRNDELTVAQLAALQPEKIILSPGPGRPKEAGICEEVVLKLGPDIPILGVCLGHQGICEAFGGTVTYAARLMHGKQSEVAVDRESKLFQGLPEIIKVARYHSLAAELKSLPAELKVTATTQQGEVMAVEHIDYPVFGVQFHPESILTPCGQQIIRNFLQA